jgi:predicted Fe-Mo cluster-binding NifX family protein
MRLGIPVWRGEVSPVFDVAGKLLVIDVEDGREEARRVVQLGAPNESERADHLAALGVDVLVCGMITGALEQLLVAAGIRVVSHVCGPVEQVAHVMITGDRMPAECLVPGCTRPRVRGREPCWP